MARIAEKHAAKRPFAFEGKRERSRNERHMKILMVMIRPVWSVSLLMVFSQGQAWPQEPVRVGCSEGYVTNGGVRIWYKVEGANLSNAIPLLMIHGGPGATARPFEKTIGPEISRNRPVIYMDYRGAGRSARPKDPGQYSLVILASDAEAIRKHLGIEKWSVFGHSNGGATAIAYALQYTGHVATIILCDPLLSPIDLEMNMIHKVALAPADKFEQARAIYKSAQSDEERFGKLLDLIDVKTRYGFQYFNPDNSAVLERIQADLAREIGKELMEPALIQGLMASGLFQFDAFKSAKDLPMPVLILLGRYDSEVSIDNAMKFALTVPDGYVTVLNQSGHHPYLEETKSSAQQINVFLSSHSGTSMQSGSR
jgi:proline iminopeptidase